MAGTAVLIRFRHPNGDVGPIMADSSWTGTDCKNKLVAEWPEEGPLAENKPGSVAQVRLIMNGGEMGPNASLGSLWPGGSEELVKEDIVVTLLVQIRPADVKPGKKVHGKVADRKREPVMAVSRERGCTCTIM